MLRTLPPQCRLPLSVHSNRPLYSSLALLRTQRRFKSDAAAASSPAGPVIYNAPLARPFRMLKIFSLTSLVLTSTLSPFILLIPAPLPMTARIGIAGSAVFASAFSTTLIAWASRSYVNVIRRKGDKGMELESADFLLRKITTTVWDTSVLQSSGRPFASWELPDEIHVQEGRDVKVGEREELARTEMGGHLQGQWIAEYQRDATGKLVGKCRAEGNVVRHFNVADEAIENTSTQ